MGTPATPLVSTLREALAAHADGDLCVGFSGGPDSSALLHALAALPMARARGLRAVHVDHGLHTDSARWTTHCRRFCDSLNLPLQVCRVRVERDAGSGLEAAAREARYAAFAANLGAGESLLLAHHRDDQAETVLLKLLRGAGPEGLGGMRARRAFAGGWLWRPLLALPRMALVAYLDEHGLDCIQDPSNRSPRHARSFLRHDILPRLADHWPQAPQALAHSARLSRAAADYIDVQARDVLRGLLDETGNSLDTAGWLALHDALRGPVLDHWLHALGLPAPSVAQRDELQRQLREAAADRVPGVAWPGAETRAWRGRLYAFAPPPAVPAGWRTLWRGEPLELPFAAGSLHWDADAAVSPPPLEVRLGQTGVHLRPHQDRHTRELRDLFQQAAIPPWRRRRCPLLYDADGTLLAVADLWTTAAGEQLFTHIGARPVWEQG